ncbi:DNA-methyltransferase [Ichthyobacterium seriolicida]|uniref:Methyltransferase n=1 Tax=Ichthyobacterium seriolicida TaxID=242600 RepID=A0A1J1DWV4_9FLAO|nr:site-specific DNA-methyltransferase [Ichthyobacterium seriolicida]BAV94335.1 type II restriction modification system, methylation subunit [Ichthyobacterium seriolicida]
MKKNNKSNKHSKSSLYEYRIYEGINTDTLCDKCHEIENAIPDDVLNRLFCKSSEKMDEIPDSSIHIVITSPPYNVGKEYDNNLSLEEYLIFLKNVFNETYRVLVNGGRACINVANLGRKPYIPISDYISKIMIDIGFNMRGEIIWNKSLSTGPSSAWGSWMSASNPTLRDTHEYILIFSKGSYKRVVNDKNHKYSTIKREDFMDFTKSIWNMKSESAKRVGHPAPFPLELPKRLIELYSFANDVVLDPFIGSGTSALAALKLNRNYIGYDTKQEYISICENRISEYTKSILKH